MSLKARIVMHTEKSVFKQGTALCKRNGTQSPHMPQFVSSFHTSNIT